MAFELPTIPNFNVQTPDVLGGQARAATLSGLLNENKLRQQLAPLQVQEQQQKVTLQQMSIDSNQKMMEFIASGGMSKFVGKNSDASEGSAFDSMGALQELEGHGIMPEVAQSLVTHFQNVDKANSEIAKNYGAAAGEFLKNRATAHTQLADALDEALHSENPASGISVTIAKFLKNPQGLSPDEISGLRSIQGLRGDALVKATQLASATLNLGAQMDAHHAELAKTAAQAKEAEQKVIPAGGISPETQQGIQKDIAVATNPEIQKGKEAVAAAEGQARANIEAATARGSNAALANVPPHLVAPASAAAEKAGVEYAAAKSVSDRMAATMAAARAGNVVAYQIIPQEGTLQITTSQGVHRINKTEIDQYAGGGSLWQRMEGHFGKALTGASIPESVLKDMADIQKIQADGAKAKYENSLATVNQTYGANFKPVEMKTLGNEPKMIRARDPQGVLHEAKEGTPLPKGWKLE